MKKILLLPIILILFTFVVEPQQSFAQENCGDYMLLQDKAHYEILTYSSKDKLQSKATYNVKQVDKSGDKVEATIHTIVYDPKDRKSYEGDFSVGCDDGTVWMDMRSIINQQMTGAEGMEMTMQGDKMLYPLNLKVGQMLEDGVMTIDMKDKNSGQTLSVMTMKITDRKVESKENVKVPAGSFEAYKISQQTEMENRAMGMKMPGMKTQTIEYYVPRIGMVRSEAYRNGKLISYSVLSKFGK